MTLIVSSTNRPNSNTFKVSKYYQKVLAEKGVDSTILDLCNLPESLISPNSYQKNYSDFQDFQAQLDAAEKLIFVIPEYNGSYPGILKLFVDACTYPNSFFDKKAALVGISTGKYGNIRGIDHFTGVCNYANLHVLPLKIHIPYINLELNKEHHLYKEDTLKFTHQQIDRFIKF